MTKKLDEATVLNELREGSAFFRDARKSPPKKDIKQTPPRRKKNAKKKKTNLQSYRVTESVSNRVTDLQSYRVTDFDDYEILDYRELKRGEMRLTWEQNKYLDDLVSEITRAMPEGERSDPQHKRITKNSIIRALVEIVRRLKLRVDAKNFRNERDLARALAEEISKSMSKL
jgi:hypothetical protein